MLGSAWAVVMSWPQLALPPCALPRVMGSSHGPSPARRKEWEQWQQAERAPRHLSLSIPTLSSPRSHHLGSDLAVDTARGQSQGMGCSWGHSCPQSPP